MRGSQSTWSANGKARSQSGQNAERKLPPSAQPLHQLTTRTSRPSIPSPSPPPPCPPAGSPALFCVRVASNAPSIERLPAAPGRCAALCSAASCAQGGSETKGRVTGTEKGTFKLWASGCAVEGEGGSLGGSGREWGGVGKGNGKKRRAGGSGEGGCTCASAVAGRGGHCVLRSGDDRSASCPTLWRGGGPRCAADSGTADLRLGCSG